MTYEQKPKWAGAIALPSGSPRYRRPSRMTDAEIEAAFKAGFVVRGNSYPVKDELKLIGCAWLDGMVSGHKVRCWVAPSPEVKAEAQRIIARGPLTEEGERAFTPAELVQAVKQIPNHMLIRQLRANGVNPYFEAAVTLADAVAGWPPTIEDFAGSFDFAEFGIGLGEEPAPKNEPSLAEMLGTASRISDANANRRQQASRAASSFATMQKITTDPGEVSPFEDWEF